MKMQLAQEYLTVQFKIEFELKMKKKNNINVELEFIHSNGMEAKTEQKHRNKVFYTSNFRISTKFNRYIRFHFQCKSRDFYQ